MNRIHNLFLILVIGILTISCNKDDNNSTIAAPPRDYAVQYATDLDSINKYIDSHYISVDANHNVTLTLIPNPNPENKISIRNQQEYPLQYKTVTKNGVDYQVYYLKLQEGINDSPTAVDSVYVSYKGNLLNDVEFDASPTPLWFQLESVVSGWAEIIPLFKTGNYDTASGPNPATFSDFGVGVMFLPSGLAYFNRIPSALVPQYSPLVFSFKLNKQRYKDHDRDGIFSKDEVDPLNPTQSPLLYDSDGDGTPNMYDVDDDNDRYLTKVEILINGSNPSFDAILNCSGTIGGIKKHLDPACH